MAGTLGDEGALRPLRRRRRRTLRLAPQERAHARARDRDPEAGENPGDASRAPLRPLATQASDEIGNEIGELVRRGLRRDPGWLLGPGVAPPAHDRADGDDERPGRPLDGQAEPSGMVEDRETLVAPVLGAAAMGDAAEARAQQGVLLERGVEALAQDGDLDEHRAPTGDARPPAVRSERDGAGDDEEDLEHART